MEKEKRPVQYVHYYCAGCREKLEKLGYIVLDTDLPPKLRGCDLMVCGFFGQITPVEICKPAPRYRSRSGGGERARAGRR